MGGYDFPGSNSNIDLHSLTGWIPERLSLKDKAFNPDKVFGMLIDRHRRGDLLTTLATGEIPDHVCERTGLVSAHAYAVLDIRQAQGHRLLLVKNPWSHLRWKGKFSERDSINWTPALKAELKYDPANARNFDDGVFYIDFASVCMFFEAIYINWNPSIFTYTYCTHDVWRAGVGPVKDIYNIGHNPQYRLTPDSDNCSIWILLTRHITEVEDFAKNKEYIAVIVYKGGKKVYLPFDPPPLIDGARINSPHYLCKIVVPPGDKSPFTLVISQYEKTATIFYSIRAYSTAKFTLEKIQNEYTFKEKVTGEWNDETAGGCGNNRDTYANNPRYALTVEGLNAEQNKVLIDLRGPRQYSVGFDVVTVTTKDPQTPYYFKSLSSGAFRSGFTVLEISPIPAGTYQIIPSTYHANQK
jgi:calpain-7